MMTDVAQHICRRLFGVSYDHNVKTVESVLNEHFGVIGDPYRRKESAMAIKKARYTIGGCESNDLDLVVAMLIKDARELGQVNELIEVAFAIVKFFKPLTASEAEAAYKAAESEYMEAVDEREINTIVAAIAGRKTDRAAAVAALNAIPNEELAHAAADAVVIDYLRRGGDADVADAWGRVTSRGCDF